MEADEKKFYERQVVVFSVGEEEFGTDISDVREIIKLESIVKVPDTETYVDGIINLRGKIVVIVDLARKLSLQSSGKSSSQRIIITELGESLVGFKVDTCNEVLRIGGDKIEDAPEMTRGGRSAGYVLGVCILEKRMITLVDLRSIVETDEMRAVHDAHKGGSARKILIVEDSAMMRGTLKSYLARENMQILEAPDGEEAIRIFDSEKPDVILLDIKLPKMSGIDVLREIKAKSPQTRIIMETSVYDDATKKECLELGASDYLKKPIDKNALLKII